MGAREDEMLARLALDRGLITLEQLGQARVKQRALREAGEEIDIARALMESGFITDDDAYGLIFAAELEAGEIRRSTRDTPAMGFAVGEPYSQGRTPTLKLPAQGPRDPARNIGAYQIVEKIGGGAMGEVYKARKAGTDRFFAVKVLSPAKASPEFIARFRREVEVACRLKHANVVRCVEFGYDPWRNSHFYVMHFVDGETLGSRVERTGPLGEHEALVTTRQIAMALRHAYESGLVHRDIKPENVMLTSTGHLKVLDLGLARPVTGGSSDLTVAGAFAGSPCYASPEQAHGESSLDIRSDLYSLGGTLYYMVTGQAPFGDGTVAEVLAGHMHGHIPWPSEVNPEVPEPLCLVIAKAMAKDPEERYQTPVELSLDLDIMLQGMEPVIAKKAPSDSTVRRSSAQGPDEGERAHNPLRPRRHRRAGRATSRVAPVGSGRPRPSEPRRRDQAREEFEGLPPTESEERSDRASPSPGGGHRATRRTQRLGDGAGAPERRAGPDRAEHAPAASPEESEEKTYEAAAAADLSIVASEKGFVLFACLLIAGLLGIVIVSVVSAPNEQLSPRTPVQAATAVRPGAAATSAPKAAEVPEGAVAFGGHAYRLFSQPKTWPRAREFCEERGGYLATICSEEENDLVNGLREGSAPVWIGLTDEREEGEFEWVTGEPVTFAAWGKGEPNNAGGDEDHVHLAGGNAWNDARARSAMCFICEWSEAPPGVPSVGLAAEYFADRELKKCVLRRTDPNVSFNWGGGSPAPGVPRDNFSARWEGRLSAPSTGEYVFVTVCDDNARLWIDGKLVVEDWREPHPSKTTRSERLKLRAGELYPLRLEFREFTGGAAVRLQWEGPGFKLQTVPPARLSQGSARPGAP